MKLHKLISRTVVATALLGATIGGTFAGINVSAADNPQSAYQSNEGSSSPYATKQGTATVTNGSLTLDSVPDFTFNNKNKEQDNQLKLANNGQLKVTDYRTKDKEQNTNQNQNVSQSNWSLSVSSNGFTNNSTNNPHDNNDWKIDFNKNNLDDLGNDGYGNRISSNTQISEPTLQTNQSSNSQDIVTNGQYGITQMSYGPNNNNGATLNVPNVQPDMNHPYTTQLTWTLKSNVNDTDN